LSARVPCRPGLAGRSWIGRAPRKPGGADGVDTAVTFAARDRLPQRQARLALAVAGGSTAVAALGAVGLQRAAKA
jgi:hypothetical protein